MRQYVGKTRNGIRVYVDTSMSHAATHLSENSSLLNLVTEALGQISADGENIYMDKDMGRVVGKSDLVETGEKDEILYAKRLNRDNFTRFAVNRAPEPTPYLTLVLRKDKKNEYEILSTWLGRAIPQFPGDTFETPESRSFWQSHALAWGKQAIQENSVTKNWPWS